jgi:hypothetical protein
MNMHGPLLTLLVAFPGIAPQDPPAPEAVAPEIDPRAERALWRMGELLKGTNSFTLHADVVLDIAHPSGQWVETSRTNDIALDRSHGVRASVRGQREHREFWCDLQTAAMLDAEAGFYVLVEVPDTMDAALDHLLDEYGMSAPLGDLLYSDPYTTLTETAQLGVYLGQQEVGDALCDHLAFRQEGLDWQIWIDAGPLPLPRQFVLRYSDVPGVPSYRATLGDWDLDAHLPPVVFEFEAPPDAERVEVEAPQDR